MFQKSLVLALPLLFPLLLTNKMVSTTSFILPSPFTHINASEFMKYLSIISFCFAVSLVSKANENQTTRSKMEQLKSIMEERKEKRKEKRFAPYEKRFSAVNLISSSADPWSASNADASVESMDTENILSKAAVIA